MITWLAVVVASLLIWLEWRSSQASANARAISLHIVGHVVPMLEARGYRPVRKQVSFGRSPYVVYNMESDHGLWIHIYADGRRGYFEVTNMRHEGDEPMNLTHRFEISGPWDELNAQRMSTLEEDFRRWRANGCRRRASQDEPDDEITYFEPMSCLYRKKGAQYAQSPTDIGYKLSQWMQAATPHHRYPLVPRLPRG